jgi:nanoRNase/pAp phosphatase (c-di-AMP/oligoRNAs hydrolase)
MKKIVVLYHKDCPDGFGAAWAAWKKFGNMAKYIPIQPRQLPDMNLIGREIYVLDNSLTILTQKKLRQDNRKLVIIDHHESARNDVLAFPENVFSNNKNSGAVLAWRYFFPEKPVPKFLKYVEGVDLWCFSLPHAHELTTYAYAQPFDFKGWSKIVKDFEDPKQLKRYIELGKVIENYEAMLVDSIVQKAELVNFAGHNVLSVNSSLKKLISFIGNKLCDNVPPFGIVWYIKDGDLSVSLRGNGTIDVSKIAGKFSGGGGHKNAAGFTIPFKGKFPWKVLKNEK